MLRSRHQSLIPFNSQIPGLFAQVFQKLRYSRSRWNALDFSVHCDFDVQNVIS